MTSRSCLVVAASAALFALSRPAPAQAASTTMTPWAGAAIVAAGIALIVATVRQVHAKHDDSRLMTGCYQRDKKVDVLTEESSGRSYELILTQMISLKPGQRYELTGWDLADRKGVHRFKVRKAGDTFGTCNN